MHGNADGLSRKPGGDTKETDLDDGLFDDADKSNQHCMQIGNASSEDRSNAGINLEPLQADDDELAMVRSWVQNGKRPEFKLLRLKAMP